MSGLFFCLYLIPPLIIVCTGKASSYGRTLLPLGCKTGHGTASWTVPLLPAVATLNMGRRPGQFLCSLRSQHSTWDDTWAAPLIHRSQALRLGVVFLLLRIMDPSWLRITAPSWLWIMTHYHGSVMAACECSLVLSWILVNFANSNGVLLLRSRLLRSNTRFLSLAISCLRLNFIRR